MTAHSIASTWDIFCKVVDNFGDAGVCWRLARILHREHGLQVRLWVDDLNTLRALHPDLDAAAPLQHAEGITVCRWQDVLPEPVEATVVIEAFGCGLPEGYIAAMAASARPPLWIVLEYLSAESWVDEHHGLSSPHPQLPLPRYFFFPGFTSATGGLLREADLSIRRDRFDDPARQRFWHDMGFDNSDAQSLTVSLFAYAGAPVAGLLETMARDAAPVVVAVPDDVLLSAVRAFFGTAADNDRGPWRRGALEVRVLPFLPLVRYDELLWACDLNFVRGEDSFVRAQWAARPMVWQPYRQEDGAHRRKAQAFLDRYAVGLAPKAKGALTAFCSCWNGDHTDMAAAWRALREELPDLAGHARRWAGDLAAGADMAARLVEFAGNKVK